MTNDSSTGGFLSPVGDEPAEDADLDKLFQPTIAALTGIDPTLVRRRYQVRPPPQPAVDQDWCSFVVTTTETSSVPHTVHYGQSDGSQSYSVETSYEKLELSLTFYGPRCSGMARRLVDSLKVDQNRAALRALKIKYNGPSRPLTLVPDLENMQFVRRADLALEFSRMVSRAWPVRSVESLAGKVQTETTQSPLTGE